jgi:hypothetical protein
MIIMPPEFLYYAFIATCFLIPMGIAIMYSIDFFDYLFDKTDKTE